MPDQTTSLSADQATDQAAAQSINIQAPIQVINQALSAQRATIISAIPDLSVDEQSQILSRGFRALRDDEIPTVNAIVRPDDYDNDLARGTVDFNPALQNYSFFTINIDDGSVIDSCNFAQAVPNTDAIVGENLTFTNCNMVNINIHKSWTLKNCLTVQSWIVDDPVLDSQGKPVLDVNGDPVTVEDRLFVCSDPSQLTGNEVAPDNAVTSRDY